MEQSSGETGNRIDAQTIGTAFQGRDITVHQYARVRPRPVPRQLPPATTMWFVNREAEQEGLDDAWARAKAAGVPLVVVCTGPAGIGKSELAVRWLAKIAGQVDGAHLYADMGDGGPRTATDVLGEFLRSVGQEPDDIPQSTPEMVGLFRTLIGAGPAIVFLDNVTRPAQVLPLRPSSPGSVVLVTARTMPQNLSGAVEIAVGPFGAEHAREYLVGVAGDRMTGPADDDGVSAVVQLCEGRPFALDSAGRQMTRLRPATVADNLYAELARLSGSATTERHAVSVVLSAGYGDLSEPAAGLYRCLGALLVRDFPAGLAAAAGGITDAAAGPLLAELNRAGLIRTLPGESFQFHDLDFDHIRATPSDAEREAALRRVLDWYLRGAVAADHALMPGRWRLGPRYEPLLGRPPTMGRDAARAWLEGDRTALRLAVHAAADREWHDLAVQLVEAQWALCHKLKFTEHSIDIHECGVASARHATERRFLGRMRCELGFAYIEQARLDEAAAMFAEARESDRAIGFARGELTAIESLGLVMLRRCGAGDLPGLRTRHPDFAAQALALLEENLRRNLAVPEEVDDERAMALAWRHFGVALSATGEHEKAVGDLRRAVGMFAGIDDRYNEGKALRDLGQALIRAGRWDEAPEVLGGAMELHRTDDDPAETVTVLETLAVVAERSGDRAEAVRLLTPAWEILAARANPRAAIVRARISLLEAQA